MKKLLLLCLSILFVSCMPSIELAKRVEIIAINEIQPEPNVLVQYSVNNEMRYQVCSCMVEAQRFIRYLYE